MHTKKCTKQFNNRADTKIEKERGLGCTKGAQDKAQSSKRSQEGAEKFLTDM